MKNTLILKIISAFGFVLFTILFAITFLITKDVEKSALDFVANEVTKQIHSKIDKLTGINEKKPNIVKKAFLKKYSEEVPELKTELKEYVKTSAKDLCGSPNPQNKNSQLFLKKFETNLYLSKYKFIKSALNSMDKLVKEKYKKTWNSLLNDIRIFSSINAASFAIVFLLCFLVKNVPKYLIFCSWILISSTIVCIYIYIYGQNWFYTILFDRYFGTGYLTMLFAMFAYLVFRLSIDYAINSANKKI